MITCDRCLEKAKPMLSKTTIPSNDCNRSGDLYVSIPIEMANTRSMATITAILRNLSKNHVVFFSIFQVQFLHAQKNAIVFFYYLLFLHAADNCRLYGRTDVDMHLPNNGFRTLK